MKKQFFTFGEILWDCLPSGRHAGGAPFNVAAHLVQLGAHASLISAVGSDVLGDELLQVAKDKNVDTRYVDRARVGLTTGKAIGTLDSVGNATYDLVQPAAWDEIRFPPSLLEAVEKSHAFIFGSLAGRSPYNFDQLNRLLAVEGPLKCFDVNLRTPFFEAPRVMELAKKADVLKLNLDELAQLVAWIRPGQAIDRPLPHAVLIEERCRVLAHGTDVERICVTMAEVGAALWDHGTFLCVPAPKVVVRDTVGAGDAFMAGLMVGLAQKIDGATVLEIACELGAFVASQYGATPLLPSKMIQHIEVMFKIRDGAENVPTTSEM